jgi:hypothetical protein
MKALWCLETSATCPVTVSHARVLNCKGSALVTGVVSCADNMALVIQEWHVSSGTWWNYTDRIEAKYLVQNMSWWHSIPVQTRLAWDWTQASADGGTVSYLSVISASCIHVTCASAVLQCVHVASRSQPVSAIVLKGKPLLFICRCVSILGWLWGEIWSTWAWSWLVQKETAW